MENITEYIKNLAILKGIKPGIAEKIFKAEGYHIKNYNKDQMILYSNDTCKSLMILLTGSIKVEIISDNGKIIRLNHVKAPELIAPFTVFGDDNIIPFNISALTDCKILKIPKDSILDMLMSDREILDYFLSQISAKFTFLFDKMQFLNFSTISGKLSYYLLKISASTGSIIDLSLSVRELSELFGVERPSLSKVIGEFIDKEIIKRLGKNKYQIINFDALIAMIPDSYISE